MRGLEPRAPPRGSWDDDEDPLSQVGPRYVFLPSKTWEGLDRGLQGALTYLGHGVRLRVVTGGELKTPHEAVQGAPPAGLLVREVAVGTSHHAVRVGIGPARLDDVPPSVDA